MRALADAPAHLPRGQPRPGVLGAGANLTHLSGARRTLRGRPRGDTAQTGADTDSRVTQRDGVSKVWFDV